MKPKTIPAGTRFGKITVLSIAATRDGHAYSECLCDCGKRKFIRSESLRRGATVSCGCYHSEVSRSKAIHGYNREGKRHPIYDVWNAMLQRCKNPKHPSHHHYGGRGIKVCKRWETFSNFLEDMIDGYHGDLTIERINNDKGYFKENCKWETRKGQMLNRRSARLITYDGKTLNMSTWSERTGIKFSTLKSRLGQLGWPPEKALTTPNK